MAITSAKELFDTLVPAKLAADPATAKQTNAVFQFKIADEGGGEWTVDLASEVPTCTAGLHGTPNCTIEMAHVDFLTLIANPQTAGMQLFFTGKLKVTGDQMLAMKLGKILSF